MTSSDRLRYRTVRSGLRLNIIAGNLGTVWSTIALGMPFVMLLEKLGASGVAIGMTSTIRQIALVLTIPSSLLIESLPRRKPFWATCALIHRFLWLVPAWLAWRIPDSPNVVDLILAAVVVSTVIENFASPAWQSWMADLVPERIRGKFWSKRQAIVMTTYLLVSAISGVALDRLAGAGGKVDGFALVLALGALFGIADIVVHTGVPEPPPQPRLRDQSLLRRLLFPLRHPSFRNLALSIGVWTFANTMAGTFNAIYLRRFFGTTYTGLSVLTVAGTVSTILGSVVASFLVDRIGARAFAVVMMILAPVTSVAWFFVTDTPVTFTLPFAGTVATTQALVLICATSLLGSGFYGTIGLCQMSLIASLAPKRGRTLAMGVHWTIVGMTGALGPVIGGAVVDWFTENPTGIFLFGGTELSYAQILAAAAMLLIWFGAVPLMLRVRARRDPLSARQAFQRIVLVNPLRLAAGIYHTHALASATRGRRERQAAARAIGKSGAEIAIDELATRLDDPSLDVREAAALSLGRIGSPQARAILLHRLGDPATDIVGPLLRALRLAPDPSAAPRVLPFLGHPDAEIAREAAHTLGHLGDPAAAEPLIDALNRSSSVPFTLAAAEALAHLGDISATYIILPRMRTSDVPFQRISLAVACGDLLGAREGFYDIVRLETAAHTSGIGPLLARTRRAVRQAARADAASPLLDEMIRRLDAIDTAYEAADIPACTARSLELGVLVARLRHGLDAPGADVVDFLEALNPVDPCLTVGLWTLAILDGRFARTGGSPAMAPASDLLEAQLAIHLAASWAQQAGSSDLPRNRPCSLSLFGH
jgi:MFS family permease